MFDEIDLTAGPLRLNVAVGPANGPPLVMLHGVGRRWQDFAPILPTLASRRHLHLVDFRGHGKSDRAAGSYRVVDYVNDALALLASLHRPALVYGHSLGALVAIASAATRPELVQAIVLEDPPSAAFMARLSGTAYLATFEAMRRLAGPNRDTAAVARDLGDTLVRTPDGAVRLSRLRDATALRFMARCLADMDGEALTPAIEGDWMAGYDEAALWRSVRCPTLLLRGDVTAGGMLPDTDADAMRSRMEECIKIDFKGVGHLIHWTAPELTLHHVLAFLDSL